MRNIWFALPICENIDHLILLNIGVAVQHNHDEEVGWGEESDSDDDTFASSQVKDKTEKQGEAKHDPSSEAEMKPSSPTSDTSYDIVNPPGLDAKKEPQSKPVAGTFSQTKVDEASDEEDWE